MRGFSWGSAVALVGASALLTACGSDDATGDATPSDRPTVAVTTNILGDVVTNLVGDEFDVVTIMPVGSDPHDFQASAQQVAQISEADVIIVNGAGFEQGLLDVIESAEADGVPVYEAVSSVEALDYEDDHDDHEDEHDEDEDEHDDHEDEHDDHEDEHDEDEHEHHGEDPHFFTDPARMVSAAEGIVEFLIANGDEASEASLRASAGPYLEELEALDAEVDAMLATIPANQRVLVTNHEVFGYFADRYGFEVVGTVVPGGTTSDSVSARQLVELGEVIDAEGVPAIFADTSSSDELARTLAGEVGDIDVVELFSESLGSQDSEGATYIEMIRTNAQRIADALGG